MKLHLLVVCFVLAGLPACGSRLTTSPSDQGSPPVLSKNRPLRPIAAEAEPGASVADGAATTDERVVETVIHVRYPFLGRTAALRGSRSPLSWQEHLPMTYVGDETYEFRTTAWRRGAAVELKPILLGDSEWRWATGANFHVTPGTTVELYPAFYDDTGRVEELFAPFVPTALKSRFVWAYLPASYYENTLATYPVLYMHDGQNCFFDEDAFGGQSWEVAASLDAAYRSGGAREFIVIGVANSTDRLYEYTPSANKSYPGSGQGEAYMQFLVDELRPEINARLRVRTDAMSTGIMGSSLGGLISAYASITRGQVFGLVGALSPSTWWDKTWIIGAVNNSDPSLRAGKVYLDSGNAGDSKDDVTNTTQLAATYGSLGYQDGVSLKHVVQDKASHNEYYWAQRFPVAVEFLFGTR